MRKYGLTGLVLAGAIAILPVVGMADDASTTEPVDTRGTKQAGDFLVRVRAIAVDPDGGGSTRPIGGDIRVQTSYAPEIDFSYFITKNIALELIAATSRHEVRLKNSDIGKVNLGATWVLPPTLTAQYHFLTDGPVSPYIGAGINYTIFYDETTGPTADSVDIDPAVGYAFQAGIDFQFPHSNFLFNVDAKRIFVSPDATVKAGGAKIKSRNFDLDPWVVGVGFGYKF